MKRNCSYRLSVIICLCFLTVTLTSLAARADTCENWVAKVVSAQGTVEARRAGETQWQPVELNGTYCPGDTIRVEKRSRAGITLVNQPVLRLDQNSTITFAGVKDERTSIIDLIGGAIHFFSRVARNLEVRTAFVNAGVEGTEGLIRVEEDKTSISIFEGKVLAVNEVGSLALTSGQSALAEAGKAAVTRIVVRPREVVRWAIYYPPVIYYRPADFQGFPEMDWRTMVQKSIESYWVGDHTGAFSAIEEVPEGIRDPRFFTYRASLLLTVGRVDEAGKDIEEALGLDPENSDAYALQSIIAVAQNENEKALSFAQKAVEIDPDSPTAKIALSYAEQASFNLGGALDRLKEAVRLGPENALAWARLANLWLSFGELGKALEAAKKGVALNPHLSRTQTVLGFAYVTQIRIKESQDAFHKAIELDTADPLPRLGLGLSMIRESNLEGGRRNIEIAVILDPDNSLIRSYLGKAYYEEKRDGLAKDQFDMAKNLDPMDPTPFFYDAIRKQTVNRPVEALHDMEKAIELNDNRAVFRSNLKLDEDLAARQASIARIYGDLGFEQVALVEGWKSINNDPANYSAHRFLSDSYAVLPRHEIARVSELLQSQLLQPLNITPVQPRNQESNLFIVTSGGSANLSRYEYNPLFFRDRFALLASGLVGGNSTRGNEIVLSGQGNGASVSAGQYHYETDGFRANNDFEDDIYNVFFQKNLSYKTSLQTEFRYRETENGDLTLRFLGGVTPELREEDQTSSLRLGFHTAFSPGSDLIGNFMYQNQDSDFQFRPSFPANFFGTEANVQAFSGELQYIHRSKYIHIVGGAGHFNIDDDAIDTFEIFLPVIPPPPPPLPPLVLVPIVTPQDFDIDHFNLHLYTYINLPENVTFTVGASADFFNSDFSDSRDRDQVNPKLGISWNPVPHTTLRAAAFRVLKRTLITNETLEPTQVAGFNQFFDDNSSTDVWRYGLAADQKFSQNVYGGAELSMRDMEIPFIRTTATTSETRKADWDEELARAYLYWTPHKWWALSAEYLYEKFERSMDLLVDFEEVKTHRLPFGVSFFHPSGMNAVLKVAYYDQEGMFLPVGANPLPGNLVPGGDEFWLVDAAVGYRLPKRSGFITLGVTNLWDRSFHYQDTDPVNPAIQPDRLFFLRISLSI